LWTSQGRLLCISLCCVALICCFLQEATTFSSWSVTSTRVGRDNSSTSCFFPSRSCCGLVGRMRNEDNIRMEDFASFVSKSRWESIFSSGKRGASVVRGERSKDGIVAALVWEGGVGTARKDRSFWGCSLLLVLLFLLSKISNTGRPRTKD